MHKTLVRPKAACFVAYLLPVGNGHSTGRICVTGGGFLQQVRAWWMSQKQKLPLTQELLEEDRSCETQPRLFLGTLLSIVSFDHLLSPPLQLHFEFPLFIYKHDPNRWQKSGSEQRQTWFHNLKRYCHDPS